MVPDLPVTTKTDMQTAWDFMHGPRSSVPKASAAIDAARGGRPRRRPLALHGGMSARKESLRRLHLRLVLARPARRAISREGHVQQVSAGDLWLRRIQGECVLEMEGVGKRFAQVWVLKDVNLKVRRGSIHAIVGHNGAGKSTLMKIALGAVKPTEGEVRVAGQAADLFPPGGSAPSRPRHGHAGAKPHQNDEWHQ